LRWAHLLAAVAWVGGGLFYLVVLRPASRALPDPWRGSLITAAQARYRELVEATIAVLVVTGAVLSFDRLSGPGSSLPYVSLLALKVSLAAWMFYLAYRMGRLAGGRRGDAGTRGRREAGRDAGWQTADGGRQSGALPGTGDPSLQHFRSRHSPASSVAPRLVLALGGVVLLLAVALRVVYGSL
jgi:uncharacterized membrane protein